MRFNLDRSPPVGQKIPTACHWCGGSLRNVRNVFKGKDSDRHYDSESCLVRGEERAAMFARAISNAGRVS